MGSKIVVVQIAILILLFSITSNTAYGTGVEVDENSSPEDKIAFLETCFKKELELDPNYSITEGTTIAFTELILVFEPQVETMDPSALCKHILVPVFLSGRDKAAQDSQKAEDQRKSQYPTLAYAGTRSMIADTLAASFVTGGHSLLYSHILGHSDITDAAVLDLVNLEGDRVLNKPLSISCECRMTEYSRELIQGASQTPDLYAWFTDSFHAQTIEHDENDEAISIRASEDSRQAVIGKSISIVAEFRKLAQQSNTPFKAGLAALELGKVFHIVQDLVFHHGLTAKQHSGLQFIKDFRNPDAPIGIEECERTLVCKSDSHAKKKLDQARIFTKQVLQAAVAGVDKSHLSNIFGLQATQLDKDTDLTTFAQTSYGDKLGEKKKQEVGPFVMWSYMKSSKTYKKPEHPAGNYNGYF